ncbi:MULTISPECIES: hypothetical protein [Bradyrhizobium]|uniref:hypothetical protein n=1 Tax=Bradyrhizobium elkanii TaxID=29448 RepID=UPI002714D4B8|nr:hypothetical protein [Bradyrhizobium elkanii]WLA47292.1 hypothetical protein QIH80_37315 [Bradyrhizobium elkanii]WLB82412.1 hypothetical protein QIH83_07460 [Bradyrhizobium elkanii]
MARKYLIDGVSMTAEEVGAIKNPTESQKQQFIKQSGISDQKLREIETLMEAIAPVIRDYVVKAVTPLVDRLCAVEQKTFELQEKPLVPWVGTWDSEKEFKRHTFCSDRGAMWFAVTDSKGVRPGSGDGVWRLCVKAGRDAR